MYINEVMKGLMEILRPLTQDDVRIFLLVYIRMLLREIPLEYGQNKLEDLKNAMEYYFDTEVTDAPARLADAFLRSNI